MSESTAESQETTPETGETGSEPSREFASITTQEEFDKRIGERIARQQRTFDSQHSTLAEKAKKYDEWQQSNMTDLQKAEALAKTLQEELDGYKTKESVAAWAKEVSEATGVPAEALRGSTKEEIEAHAESLKQFFPATPVAPVVAGDGKQPAAVDAETGDWLRNSILGS